MADSSVVDSAAKSTPADEFAYAGRLGYPLKIHPRVGSNGLENPMDFFADLLGSRIPSRTGRKNSDMPSSDQYSDMEKSIPQFDLGWDATPARVVLPSSDARSSNLPRPKISTPTRELTAISSNDAFDLIDGGDLPPPSPIGFDDDPGSSTIRDSVQVSRVRPYTSSKPDPVPSFQIFASSDSGVGGVATRNEKTTHPASSPSNSGGTSLGIYRSAKRKVAIPPVNQNILDEGDYHDYQDNYMDAQDDVVSAQDDYMISQDHIDEPDQYEFPQQSRPKVYEDGTSDSESDIHITSRVIPRSSDDENAESELDVSDYNSDASVMDMVVGYENTTLDYNDFDPTMITEDSDIYEEWDTGDMEGETTLVVPRTEPPNYNSAGLRRSRRHKIEPVRYWLGEKPVYKLSRGTFLPTLKEVIKVEDPEPSVPKARPRKKKRNDDLADSSVVVAQVFDAEKMGFEFREVAKKLDWENMQPTRGNPKVKVQVLFPKFDNLPISIEGLCFERGAKIPEQNTGPYAYVVSVLTGHFQFQLHQKTIELRRGASLGVQRGNDFGVDNVGPGQGTLFMIKIHADMFERGILNEESFSNLPEQMSRSMNAQESRDSHVAADI
ncbi:Centromere protein 3 [Wickerhamiella sorbophila]|uniref:Centromere protein 3 n=1 Tax=Wickerhamiella sorbophila TaxID=45607 RepID=A0A2T0FLD4_9ASCO|nr:Centromere protein 3 [Wickerhamiella sorbophila]PRT55796.1 Centromere protein 3 [Wickerhamiella sorbophila]